MINAHTVQAGLYKLDDLCEALVVSGNKSETPIKLNIMQKTFQENPKDWQNARRPNYNVNQDFKYPYSECPFLGDYHLIRIPENEEFLHVDYWGEGRITDPLGISGFPDCYNVNHTYQLVSNGDVETIRRKIPNRIPVITYSNCRTGSYIKDNSVEIVTLMSAPINKSCATDITRMVHKKKGIVVLYGIDRNTEAAKNLEQKLTSEKLLYCSGFKLPKRLQGLTLYYHYLAYVNLTEFKETLFNAITSAEYDNAVNMFIELRITNNGYLIDIVVDWLLKGDNQKTMAFAYKLWVGGGQDIVVHWFPSEFQDILRSDNVTIVSHYYNQALKLDSNMTSNKDRLAWGDSNDKTSVRVTWKIIPQMENNHIFFKIKNMEHSMFLKLEDPVDSDGDRKGFGSEHSFENKHMWALEPVRYKDKILFFIINYDFQQGLKLAVQLDTYGDRLLYGHNANVVNNPDYFGWLIKAI
ncbi:hypothetical protein K1T71_004734 [Dendrolimus kikuchii]|uniref:Uncharacterized protein n=1 Tax=Dendrolimus kikuchii TaxID=765133 RepID=A0ACC1D886_9NEOP|nr:hypothetical protein K1T71_004734 [Dendrolimus kikuchii]